MISKIESFHKAYQYYLKNNDKLIKEINKQIKKKSSNGNVKLTFEFENQLEHKDTVMLDKYYTSLGYFIKFFKKSIIIYWDN
jgi:hypothetical protein